jgi:co-chaperonin GroES (HSP10)
MELHPLPGFVLVELQPSKYQHIAAPSKAYEGKSNGVVVAIGEDYELDHNLVGKRVFWTEYKEGSPISYKGKSYVFVDIAELQGYEDAPSD